MDGKLIVFKNSSIWVMYGNNGPAPTSQGSDWTVPQRIPSNEGAIGNGATISTDVGVFFQSATGIHLLGRDLSVSFIGAPMIDMTSGIASVFTYPMSSYLATSYPTITSATIVGSATQVRWTANNGSTSVTVVYDYLLKQWMNHTYPEMTAVVQSSCMTYQYPQQFTVVTADGNLWQENLPTASQPWMDQDTSGVWHFVPTVCTLAWVKTALQGYMRALDVQLYSQIQTGNNACGLQISLAINNNPNPVQTVNWPPAVLTQNPIPGQVSMFVGAQWNQAMSYQFSVQDTDGGFSGESGQGARFVNLTVALEKLGDRYPFLPVSAKQ
jgi:hypothetical protein